MRFNRKISVLEVSRFTSLFCIMLFIGCIRDTNDQVTDQNTEFLFNDKLNNVILNRDQITTLSNYIFTRKLPIQEHESWFNKIRFGFPEETERTPIEILVDIDNWDVKQIYLLSKYGDIPLFGEMIITPKGRLLNYFISDFIVGFYEESSQIGQIPPTNLSNIKYNLVLYTVEDSLENWRKEVAKNTVFQNNMLPNTRCYGRDGQVAWK